MRGRDVRARFDTGYRDQRNTMHYRPFDRTTSLRLDAVIVLLESDIPRWLRLALRWYKRRLERNVAA
jgi:hypothetical protein